MAGKHEPEWQCGPRTRCLRAVNRSAHDPGRRRQVLDRVARRGEALRARDGRGHEHPEVHRAGAARLLGRGRGGRALLDEGARGRARGRSSRGSRRCACPAPRSGRRARNRSAGTAASHACGRCRRAGATGAQGRAARGISLEACPSYYGVALEPAAMVRRSSAVSSVCSSTPCSRATSRSVRPVLVASLTMSAALS